VIVALTHAYPSYIDDGLRALPASPIVYLTAATHHGFLKISRIAGLGSHALRAIALDGDLKMDVAALAKQVAEDRKAGFAPLMVVGTAGTTGAGVIDPLPQIAQFCKAENLWFHADAAWGGAAAISPKLRPHLDGIEHADSITCDAHKWFSVPMGAGMFFCRHHHPVLSAFESEISFMPRGVSATIDPYSATFQWSRRFIGLKLFLALAERGESGYAEMIEHQARMGDVLRDALQQAGWRIVNKTPLPLVCFTRDRLDTSKFLPALYKSQIAWMSQAQLGDGPPVLRACITSYRTTEQDIAWAVREMSKIQ
jgi:glutamate/tyrosine decarboxylase-like PLP-dependent enzyme